MDTIFALSTAPGRAGVAVLRVSGAGARQALEDLSGGGVPAPRQAQLAELRDPGSGQPIDRALLLWFPGPRSFTGEDVAEFHVHGGRAVIESLLTALGRVPGLRLAEPGEFARRAFAQGKLDLTEAEGLADLINAETEGQRLQALRQMRGELSNIYEGWRTRLIRVLAYAEADIDFAEEELPDALLKNLQPEIRALSSEIMRHLDDGGRGERLRDGVEVAIIGPPNVGKSSLLNRLAGREAAIVSEEAGTTRDVLEVRLDLAGVPVILADTAGLREAAGAIEAEGVRRALARAEAADLRLVIAAAGSAPDFSLAQEGDLKILNKADLGASRSAADVLAVSAKNGEGFERLLAMLSERVRARFGLSEHPGVTRARHREGLEAAGRHLEMASSGIAGGVESALVAEELRLAMRALGRITGRVDVEDLLDVVFRDFCIGK